MAVFLDTFLEMTPTALDAWETKDLSGAPYNLPANAVGVMGLVRNTAMTDKRCGWRKFGSTDDRYHYVPEPGADSVLLWCGR